jgi:phosphoglycerate dehydrogenase-like enzyme
MWRSAFEEAGIDGKKHDVKYVENIPGSFKWSSEIVNGVKEANGNPDFIKEKIAGCEVVVSSYAPFTSEIMDASNNLKIIAISRGGPVNVDHAAATNREIKILRTIGRNAESVADQTIGFIISESRLISRHNHEIKNGKYFDLYESGKRSDYLDSFTWMELNGKTLGLIGFGQVGSRVAKRAHAFGMNVIVYDPYVDTSILKMKGCLGVNLDYLLKNSDFVSIHTKLTPETYHMINDETLAMMKKTSVLINTARGNIIDEKSLFKALKTGVISSAALDVFEQDPIKRDNPLILLDNVTLTPHTAGRSPFSELRGYQQIALQVARYLNGEEINPLYVSNKEVL